jgi:hypothetical protein
MNSGLDEMLRETLLEVPDDFAARVLERLPAEPRPSWPAAPFLPARLPVWQLALRWLVFGAGFLLGAAQLAAFMLGLWLSAAVA